MKTTFLQFKRCKRFIMFMMLLNVIGCQKTLYNKLKEKEANAMMVLLEERGIASEKVYDDRAGTVSLQVAGGDIAKSINILRENGYPRDEHTNLGEVFAKNSLISSPTEEHARYTYALSEDLSQTLSELDGVVHAKVHLVLPKGKRREKTPASAAVFIKHSSAVKMDHYIPQIKLLVQGSVEGLKYEDVNVALFPTLRSSSAQARSESAAPTSLESFNLSSSTMVGIAALAGVMFLLLAAYSIAMSRKRSMISAPMSQATRSEG